MIGLGLVLLTALAQAEAAPPEPAPPPPSPPPAPPPEPTPPVEVAPSFGIGIGAGGARRFGEPPRVLTPRYGFEVNADFTAIYTRLGIFDLGAGVHFNYQRFRTLVPLALVGASTSTYDSERTFSFYEFHVRQSLAAQLGFARPYLTVGGGLSLANFNSQEAALAPASLTAFRLGLSAAAGCDFPMTRRGLARFGLVVGMAAIIRPPDLETTSGRNIPVFGTRASAGVTFWQPF
ncbi:MAG TPA: hypothetical protein VGF45_04830 [Polyangia bacterium]